MCGSDKVLTFCCFFTPFALFFSTNRKIIINQIYIFFENMEFAKINTRKKQSKHHSQKFVPAKICTNKVEEYIELLYFAEIS